MTRLRPDDPPSVRHAQGPVVQTSAGSVRGRSEGGIQRFLGVPYAAPPFGADRFAPPRAHAGWAGIRDASEMGPTPPQAPYDGALGEILPGACIPGQEILNLNIWTPDRPAEDPDGHPVLVWVPGGALTRGSNALEVYDGSAFARDGIVLASVNYRLGAEGFAVLDDAPRNLGLADIAEALSWVQANITAFGGDPARVTLAGHSAGGGCVAALLAHPHATRWFARAIIQSALLGAAPAEHAATMTRLIADRLEVATTRSGFAGIAPQVLVDTQRHLTGGSPLSGGPTFQLAIDGDLIPDDPAAALATGRNAYHPVLIGVTSEEHRLWLAPDGLLDALAEADLAATQTLLGIDDEELVGLRMRQPGASPGELLGVLITDRLLRQPALALAAARHRYGGLTWLYEFGWPSPVHELGAAHGMELGFVFDTLHRDAVRVMTGPTAPQHLADAMHYSWVRFASCADPGWAAWDASPNIRMFDGRPPAGAG